MFTHLFIQSWLKLLSNYVYLLIKCYTSCSSLSFVANVTIITMLLVPVGFGLSLKSNEKMTDDFCLFQWFGQLRDMVVISQLQLQELISWGCAAGRGLIPPIETEWRYCKSSPHSTPEGKTIHHLLLTLYCVKVPPCLFLAGKKTSFFFFYCCLSQPCSSRHKLC